MHEYYKNSAEKLKETMDSYLKLIAEELEASTGKEYKDLFDEIWDYYEKNLLEKFPYIGGDKISGTKNLTGAYYYVAMGEVIKEYGVSQEEIGYLMALSQERNMLKIPKFIRKIFGKLLTKPRLLNHILKRRELKNARNAEENPGSFRTKTKIPPERGYSFSYHNLACPLLDFAHKYGYDDYMPYICNLDYVIFGSLNVPLYREHTLADGGEYCDFKLKKNAEPLDYWPPVFKQDKGYK